MKKRKILEGISSAEFVTLWIALSAMDSPDPTVPLILIAQALAWLVLVTNRLDDDWEEDEWNA